jgi:hypothetical protein
MMEMKASEAWLATEIMTGYVRICRRGRGVSVSTAVLTRMASESSDGRSLVRFGTVWSDPINHDLRGSIIRRSRAHLLEQEKCDENSHPSKD